MRADQETLEVSMTPMMLGSGRGSRAWEVGPGKSRIGEDFPLRVEI
jgi:hypothetical protein